MSTEDLRGQGINPQSFERNMFTQFQTWLGETKGIEGCPVNCKYCFFMLDGLTPMRPLRLTSPEIVLEQLRFAPTYQKNIPVHFGSQTDAFSTKSNIEYYSRIVELYGQSKYENPLIFITKRQIPNSFIELSQEIPQDVIFYISYSGLAGTGLEPTVVESHQRDNFIRLHEYNVPVVHYWRPFTPLNSDEQRLRYILDHVSQYSSCSVVNGLRLNSGIRDHVSQFWPELQQYNFDFSTLGEVWPVGVRDTLHQVIRSEYSDYPVFFGNTPCSVSKSLSQPDRAGLFNGRMCRESNCDQRELCNTHHKKPELVEVINACAQMGITNEQISIQSDMIEISGSISTQSLVYLRNNLRFPVISGVVEYVGGHNWANVTDDIKITEV